MVFFGTVSACLGVQRFVQVSSTVSTKYIAIEVLSDDVVHVEASQTRKIPSTTQFLYTSQMIDQDNYQTNYKCGPTSFTRDGNVFQTSVLKITVDPASLSLTVYDKTINAVLTTFSYSDLSQELKYLFWTKEQTQAVYGIQSGFAADSPFGSPNGNYLGKSVSLPTPRNYPNKQKYGNAMQAFDQYGASCSFQLPIFYSLGSGNYSYSFFLDNVSGHNWDLTNPTFKVDMIRTLRFYIFQGNSLLDLRRKYMTLVGKPRLPAKEYFGMQQSLYGYRSFDQAFSELALLRQNKIPVDGIVFDLQWYSGDNLVPVDPEQTPMGSLVWNSAFPNPQLNVQKLRDTYGVGISVIEQPYVGCQVDKTVCAGLDTTPQVDIVGHWMDLGDPEMYNDWQVYNGYQDDQGNWFTSEADVHNIYQLLASKEVYQGYLRKNLRRRASGLVRSGAPGIQRYGVALWSGDVSSYLPVLGNHLGAQKHAIMGGIDFFGSDVGGFNRPGSFERNIDQGVTFTRWLMVSSWMDVPLRPHANSKPYGTYNNTIITNPAAIGDTSSNKFNIVQRYELVPFYYSQALKAYLNAEPLICPMFLCFQSDPNTWSLGSQYLIGNALLAAFNTDYGSTSTSVYLPQGTWFNYHTHQKVISTGQSFTFPLVQTINGKTIQTTPVFAKQGSIVPKQYVDDQTMNTHNQRLDQSTVNVMSVRVWPSDNAKTVVYDDDGETNGYQAGQLTATVVEQSTVNGSILVTIRQTTGSFSGSLLQMQYRVELVTDSVVASVQVNGQTLSLTDQPLASGYYLDPTRKVIIATSPVLASSVDKQFMFQFQ
ncbi:glycosyl hydrolases family 31-domain-containing protein [Gorgonomyces haynaldii]|nr:glycosyl hydrolases family 31-domain-containing protein [Gorgonomyces haynaldii]